MIKTYDPNALKVYTDGSAMPNPGKGGIGIVIEFPDNHELENIEISEGYRTTNNNRMEMLACIRAFEWLQNKSNCRGVRRAIIITDSQYVYNNYKNVGYWKKNSWKASSGKPYENSDLWDTFLKEKAKVALNVEIEWEKGKTKTILLRVDKLAKEGAKHPTRNDYGYQSGKIAGTRTGIKKAALLFPANGQEITIRVYRKSVYGKNENAQYKIYFDEYSKSEKVFTMKYVAYRGKDCIQLERNNCYKARFNTEPTYPVIIKAKPFKYPKKS